MNKKSGQVVVEYVLLLLVAAGLALLISRTLISRNPDEPGIFTGKWQAMLQVIAQDLIP